MLRRLVLALAASLCCASVQAAELIVSAAASLTNALREVGRLFEAQNPGHKVVLNFASSDILLAQVAQGAPVDVFAAADMETMDRAEKQRLLAPGTRRTLLRNSLVLIAPVGSSATLTGLSSLEQPAVRRIAIGNPASVPAGRYARAAMEQANVWKTLEPKLIFAQNVRQALDYVARSEVDAGLVYATDAAVLAGKVRLGAEVPTTTPIAYPVALVQSSRNRGLAESFSQLLDSDAAWKIYARYGFRRP